MNRKIMLLALAAISATMFALPSVASAFVPNHTGKIQTGTVSGGAASLSTASGLTVICSKVTGTAKATSTTTGTLTLTFHGCASSGIPCQSGATSGTIETSVNNYHLVTLTNKGNGVLVTPPTSGTTAGLFAQFTCGFLSFKVQGNGVLGTITSPGCNAAAQKTATFDFNAPTHGVQEHTTVEGTTTVYRLTSNGTNAAEDAEATVTYPEADSITCT